MRFTGTLKTWNDDRGFGFIEAVQGGQELFVHIKDFPSGTGRPRVGQSVSFEVVTARDGKKRARAVQYPRERKSVPAPRSESPASWTMPRLIVLPAFVVLYLVVVRERGFLLVVPLVYLGMSLVAFVAYAVDKAAARARRWRTPESTLHLMSLAGGWPGALLAQQLLRHKTSKRSFVVVFWLTVFANVVLLLTWTVGGFPSLRPPGLH